MKMFKSISIRIGLFSCLALLTACQSAELKVSQPENFQSPKGVSIASLWPKNASMIAKVGENGPETLARLNKLMELFPQNPLALLKQEIEKSWPTDLPIAEYGLKTPDDLWQIIGMAPEMYLAVDIDEWLNEIAKIDLEDDQKMNEALKKLRAMALLVVASPEKTQQLLDRAVEMKALTVETGSEGRIYAAEEVVMALKSDVLIVSNQRAVLDEALKAASGQSAWLEKPAFQTVKNTFGGSLGWMYLDYEQLMKVMEVSPELREQLKLAQNGSANPADLETLVMQIRPENNGMLLLSEVKLKNGAWKKMPKLAPVYLKDKIPGEKVLVYVETSGLAEALKMYQQILANEPQAKEILEQAIAYLAKENLDFTNDIVPLFASGSAFSMDADNGYLPNLQLYFDTKTGQPQKAKQVAELMNKSLDLLIAESGVEKVQLAMFFNRKAVEGLSLWQGKFNLDLVVAAAPESIKKRIEGQKFEIYYGLTRDNLLTIAARPNLDKNEGAKVTVAVDEALKSLPGYSTNVSYISVTNFLNYADSLIKLIEDSGQEIDLSQYSEVKAYLEPFKEIISANSVINSDVIKSALLIRMN